MWFQAHLKNAEDRVSIPMTVLGGLQYEGFEVIDGQHRCFNTDDGIRRATILCP